MSARAEEQFNSLGQGTLLSSNSKFSGGPQCEALNIKKQNNGVIIKHGMYKFAVITDIPMFLEFIKREPKEERNWYTIATEFDFKRGWIDFEFLVDIHDKYTTGEPAIGILHPKCLAQKFAVLYIDTFNHYYREVVGFSIDETDLLWSSDHRPAENSESYKYSWHIIVNIVRDHRLYLYENIIEEGRFFRLLMRRLNDLADKGDVQAKQILKLKQPDACVYTKNRAFRLLHCSKYPNDQTTLEVDKSINSDMTVDDRDHFPIYHQSLGIPYTILPLLKGKRKLDNPNPLVGASPMSNRRRSNSTGPGDTHPVFIQRILSRDDPVSETRFNRFRISAQANYHKQSSYNLKTLPLLAKYSPLVGILRGFFRRCPREYDVVRYAEENGLNISQIKPWSEQFPDTYVYRFDSTTNTQCPNGNIHHSNGSAIIWKYTPMEGTVEMVTDSGLPISTHLKGFGKLEHKCLDPDCYNGYVKSIDKHYGDHYGLTLTPYWIPVDVIYKVITKTANITSVISWLIRRLISDSSGITKLIKTTNCWFVWNGLVWESTNDPADTISGFLELYISSMKENFTSGSKYWLSRNSTSSTIEEVRTISKYISFALDELLKNIRNVSAVQTALSAIEIIFTKAPTLIDGPSSEGWLVLGTRYLNMKEGTFHPPRPDLYISQVIKTPWTGATTIEEDLNHPLPKVNAFLNELFGDREENEYTLFIRDIQMFLGYSLTGKGNLQTVAFMYGSGRNGKGLFCRLFKSTLMDETCESDFGEIPIYDPAEKNKHKSNIRLFLGYETIEQRLQKASPTRKGVPLCGSACTNIVTNLDKKIICKNARSAENAHTAQLMGLLGARCVIFDELNAREELDLAKFKQYTGGDAIVVRAAYNKETFIIQKPMFTFLITTNVLPGIAPEPSVISRIKVIQFNIYFDPSMRDDEEETRYRKRGNFSKEDIIKSMDMKCEFLRWLTRGAYMFYKTNNINWCSSIRNDTEEFWGQSDIFRMFIEDTFEICSNATLITQNNISYLVNNRYYIKVADFESMLANYYNDRNAPANQIIPLQRVYQRLYSEYKVIKFRTAKHGLQRAVYLFGLRLLVS